jgi:hypothetical protein
MRLHFFLAVLFCSNIGFSQDLRGFYTGELKINRVVMGVQLELIPNNENFTAIFRTRYPENNVITGCDNLLVGRMDRQTLKLEMKIVLKETEVPAGSCNFFNTLRLQMKQNGAEIEASGELQGTDGFVIGRLTLNRADTALSFTVADELEEANRKLKEAAIANVFEEEKRAELMLDARAVQLSDSITLTENEVKIRVDAPEADRFHKVSIMVNGNPVLINKAPKQTPVQVTLQDLPPGETYIYLICHHVLVDVYFPAIVQLKYGDQIKTIEIPISTSRNQVIKVIRSQPQNQ